MAEVAIYAVVSGNIWEVGARRNTAKCYTLTYAVFVISKSRVISVKCYPYNVTGSI
ncbi:MAG: hypothetical protein EBR82_79220 [Caulobacteraceae bacterium]|nr:hypothetical protein [Caulobacteraceae bacterium]